MSKLRSIVFSTRGDHRARGHCCAHPGQIWRHEHRLRLVPVGAQGTLQTALTGFHGMDCPGELLARIGYAGIGAD